MGENWSHPGHLNRELKSGSSHMEVRGKNGAGREKSKFTGAQAEV